MEVCAMTVSRRDFVKSSVLTVGALATSSLPTLARAAERPKVYFSRDLSAASLIRLYGKVNKDIGGKIAVKLHTGEPGGPNILPREWVRAFLAQLPNATVVECNVLYDSPRQTTAGHRRTLEQNGWTAFTTVDIMDEDGDVMLPVPGGKWLKEVAVGKHLLNYDSMVVLTHFKGHVMGGFGGSLKNISIGLGSSEGKAWIHSGGTSRTNVWGGDQDAFLESMAEAGKSVSDYLGGGENIVYINVMNRLSVDCDCDGNPAEPDMHDIGILASTDPVALDQACIDLVYAAEDGQSLINRIESRNGLHTLEHAERIGLGSRAYELVNLDA